MRSVKNKISDSTNRVNKEKEKKSETPQNDKKHQQCCNQSTVKKYPTCNHSQRYIRNNT